MARSRPSTSEFYGEHAYDEQGNYIGPDYTEGEEGAEAAHRPSRTAEAPGADARSRSRRRRKPIAAESPSRTADAARRRPTPSPRRPSDEPVQTDAPPNA